MCKAREKRREKKGARIFVKGTKGARIFVKGAKGARLRGREGALIFSKGASGREGAWARRFFKRRKDARARRARDLPHSHFIVELVELKRLRKAETTLAVAN